MAGLDRVLDAGDGRSGGLSDRTAFDLGAERALVSRSRRNHAATERNSLRQGIFSFRTRRYEILLFRTETYWLSGWFPRERSREAGGPEQGVSSAEEGINTAHHEPLRVSTGAQYAMRLRQFLRR
jgi:hypothetical protein